MNLEKLTALVIEGLEDVKAEDIVELDIRDVADYADLMIVASGTTSRQVKAIAARVVEYAKEAGEPPVGVEGEDQGEWVLIDLGMIVVHVMLPWVREYYAIEKLWSADLTAERQVASDTSDS